MTQMPRNLQAKIENDPERSLNVIVCVDGDLDTRQKMLQASGFHIRRRLGLIKGFAVTAPGSRVQSVAEEPWVTSVEEDHEINAA